MSDSNYKATARIDSENAQGEIVSDDLLSDLDEIFHPFDAVKAPKTGFITSDGKDLNERYESLASGTETPLDTHFIVCLDRYEMYVNN